jgi:hypothetical protein
MTGEITVDINYANACSLGAQLLALPSRSPERAVADALGRLAAPIDCVVHLRKHGKTVRSSTLQRLRQEAAQRNPSPQATDHRGNAASIGPTQSERALFQRK